jgi:hypothetical protein
MNFSEKKLGPAHELLELLTAQSLALQLAVGALIQNDPQAKALVQSYADGVETILAPVPISDRTLWLVRSTLSSLASPTQ